MSARELAHCYLALLVLLVLTVASAFFQLGTGNIIVNVGIAGAKAVLIAWVFMHLGESAPTIRIMSIVIVVWIAILLSLTLLDVAGRSG